MVPLFSLFSIRIIDYSVFNLTVNVGIVVLPRKP